MRTNPPFRSQLQNDSAPFLNKLSINNREFGYTVKMRLFCYVKHYCRKNRELFQKISYLIRDVTRRPTSHFAKVQFSEEVGQGSDQNAVDA